MVLKISDLLTQILVYNIYYLPAFHLFNVEDSGSSIITGCNQIITVIPAIKPVLIYSTKNNNYTKTTLWRCKYFNMDSKDDIKGIKLVKSRGIGNKIGLFKGYANNYSNV